MCNEINVQIKKEDQVITNKVQVAEKNNGFIYEDESFHLPDKLAVNKNDTNDFHLDDTENKPPVKKTSLTKFNVLQRKENISEQINMRCKADRAKLNGWDCWECEEYYKNLLLSKDELQKRKNQCSRHRHKYERPSTPEGIFHVSHRLCDILYKIHNLFFQKDFGIQNFLRHCQAHIGKIKPNIYVPFNQIIEFLKKNGDERKNPEFRRYFN
ncbi:hypothetical protein ACFW04_003931 [Cataglyphis niger]